MFLQVKHDPILSNYVQLCATFFLGGSSFFYYCYLFPGTPLFFYIFIRISVYELNTSP